MKRKLLAAFSAPAPRPPALRPALAEWVVQAVILLFCSSTLLQAFVVPTASMDATLKVGDHLFVDKLAYAPAGSWAGKLLPYSDVRRGDVIVFRYPLDIRETYVKRCMGVPGDRIRISDKHFYVNGRRLEEPYVQHIDPRVDPYRDNFPMRAAVYPTGQARDMIERHTEGNDLVIPQGQYFAMGDNRDNSSDSRYWGFVPRENIIGKPLLIYWSFDAPSEHLIDPVPSLDHVLDVTAHFFTRTRWERTFKLVQAHRDAARP